MATIGCVVVANIFSGSAPASTMRSPSGAWITYELTSKPPMSRRTCSISATKGLLAFVGSGQRRAVAGDPTNIVDVGDRPDLACNLLDVGKTRRLEREPAQGRAVFDGVYPRRVHHDAASQRDVPHDVIARHWAAAAGQTRQNPARTHDPDPRLRVGPTLGVWQGKGRKRRGTRSVRLLFLLGLYLLDHAVGDVFGGEGAQTHGGEHVVRGRTVGALGDLLPNRGINLLDALLLEERHDLLASQGEVVLSIGLVEELTDLVACPTALDHGEPVPARLGRLSGDDLHPVAGDELGV